MTSQPSLAVVGQPEEKSHLATTVAPGWSVPFSEAESCTIKRIVDVLSSKAQSSGDTGMLRDVPAGFAPLGDSVDGHDANRLVSELSSFFSDSIEFQADSLPRMRKEDLETDIVELLKAVPANCSQRLEALSCLLSKMLFPLPRLQSLKSPLKLRMFAVRHQERGADVSFLADLTEEGFHGARTENLKMFEGISPDQIYCSSVLRCLQTIEPYICKQKAGNGRGLPVKIEYSIYEHALDPRSLAYFDKHRVINDKVGGAVPPEWIEQFSLDVSYRSFLSRHALPVWNQNLPVVHERMRRFLRHLIIRYGSVPQTILLCSHATTILSMIHVTSGTPMEDLKIGMGEMIELDLTRFVT